MRLLVVSLLITFMLIGSLSCSPAIPPHETERLKKLESALAPYILPAKFDEERVEHFNLRNERISKLVDILEPHDVKLQVSEQALQQSFPLNGLSGFTIQRTVDQCVRYIDGCWLYHDNTVFVAKDPSEFDQALQKKYEQKFALSLLVNQQNFQIGQIEMGVARLPMKVLTYVRFGLPGGLPENIKLDNISWQDIPLKEIFRDLESAVGKVLDKNANHSKKEYIEDFEITLLLEDDVVYERKKSYHFKNSSIESIISTICEENQLHSSGHSATDDQFYIVPLHPSILIGAGDRN
ncbi:MAG: hypothetical protein P8P90_06520, partial [Opitutales bacterium]|nr:hypothetical protein [Opitutales bacterium]